MRGSTKGGDLGRFFHVDDDVRAPRAIHVDEVGGLRLEIFHYRLDGRTEGAVLYQLISLLHRNAARDHEAHEPYFSFLPLVGPKRAVAFHQRIGCHQSSLQQVAE
jgi:hypothetical protein